jgi:peptidoglycan/xylan/chitin deacetylase (PgdA/CDA1 family)
VFERGLRQAGKKALTRAGRLLPLRGGCRALLYHSFDAAVIGSVRQELEGLKRIASPVTAAELLAALEAGDEDFFARPTFLVTIDDGYRNVFEHSRSMFAALAIKPVLFVPVEWIGFDGHDPVRIRLYFDEAHRLMTDADGRPRPFVSTDELRTLLSDGWEIGSHTMSHIDLTHPDADLSAEIASSRAWLEGELSTDVTMFSFPHGQRRHVSAPVLDHVRSAGYKACFSCSGGRIGVDSDPLFLNREVVDEWWSGGMTEGVFRGVLDPWRRYDPPDGL